MNGWRKSIHTVIDSVAVMIAHDIFFFFLFFFLGFFEKNVIVMVSDKDDNNNAIGDRRYAIYDLAGHKLHAIILYSSLLAVMFICFELNLFPWLITTTIVWLFVGHRFLLFHSVFFFTVLSAFRFEQIYFSYF